MARVLQRVILPADGDNDVLPLYVEGTMGRVSTSSDGRRQVEELPGSQRLDQVLGRGRYRVTERTSTSFATFFNAFPAAYWRRWTSIGDVRLVVRVSGPARVSVYRSNARGNIQRQDVAAVAAEQTRELVFDLTLANFTDGGWYWFDVSAGDAPAVIESAHWETDVDDSVPRGTVSVAITTLNRPDDIVALVNQMAADERLREVLDEVIVVDQGVKHPEDAEGFAEAVTALGGRARVIRQANLGGSGGFARGMLEVLESGRSDHVLLSDDDVRTEPEGIVRAATFADLARTPTIVGGHMFSLYQRSLLHTLGERVQPWQFMWGPVRREQQPLDLAESNLRTRPEMHRRTDVEYNGWWQCLIPVTVLREVGLSLPFFIKWDDAEYGLRAREVGVPTVTLPGVGVWHVPWTDKDDSIDWQAYYHARNRVVAALLHSRYERGGRLIRDSFAQQVKFLLASQYSVAELRIRALRDVLAGPEHLHATLATSLPEVRRIRGEFDDAKVERDTGAFPEPKRAKMPRKGEDLELPSGKVGTLAMAVLGVLRQLSDPRGLARTFPEAHVAAQDARWWLLAQYDSAVVSTADGAGAAWYHRSPELFRRLLAESVDVHRALYAAWPGVSRQYRDALPQVVSSQAWKSTFEAGDPDS